jgi:hypothetical protein
MRPIVRELSVFLLFVVLAVGLTWPLATHMGSAVADLGDPLLNAWIVDWDVHALSHAPSRIYDAPIFFPARYPLAFSENLIGVGLVMLPFHLVGLGALPLYNLALILGFACSGYGAYVLSRTVTRGALFASILAGVFYAFVSFKFDHLSHLQIIWSGWIPLLLAALLAYWRKPTIGRAACLCGAFVMNGLTNIHWLLFGSFAVAATMLFFVLCGRFPRQPRFWLQLGAALGLGGLLLLPVLTPYRVVAKEYGMRRGSGEAAWGSATWSDWLVATPRSLLYGQVADEQVRMHERSLFPGVLVLLLGTAAFFLRRRGDGEEGHAERPRRREGWRGPVTLLLDGLIILFAVASYIGAITADFVWTAGKHLITRFDNASIPMVVLLVLIAVRLAIRLPAVLGGDDGSTLGDAVARSRFSVEEWAAALWIAIGLLGSFGMHAFFHRFLFHRFEAFQSIRIPARWAIIAYVGLSVWLALGVRELIERRVGWRRTAAMALLALFAIADVLPRIRWEQAVADPPPLYRFLGKERIAPTLELPVNINGVEYLYLLGATTHHMPIANGTSGFEPPLFRTLRERGEHHEMDDAYTALLERNGIAYVAVHADYLYDQVKPTLAWLRQNLANGRLAFVRRFDHRAGGDWLFAVTRVARGYERLRAPEVPDGAGNLPSQNLARFLGGQSTYSTATFGYVGVPRNGDEVFKEMRVAGWAFSPHGIARVDVLIDGGRVRIPATLVENAEAKALFPWYYETPRPGFVAVIPKRPKNVPKNTELQVELIDGTGRATRMSDVMVTWH